MAPVRTSKASRTPRARSAYQMFVSDRSKDLTEMSLGDRSRHLSAAWKTADEETKRVWQERAARAKDAARLAIESAAAQEGAAATCSQAVRTKRRPTAFILFSKHYRSTLPPTEDALGFAERSRACGAAWHALEEASKQEWRDKSRGARVPDEDVVPCSASGGTTESEQAQEDTTTSNT